MTDAAGPLTLAEARAVIAGVFAKAAEMGLRPLSVVVTDPGGYVVSLDRQDGAAPMTARIVQGKTSSALGFSTDTRGLSGLAERSPVLVASLTGMMQGMFVPVAGGLLIRDSRGHVRGAVGVGGDSPDNDETCAKAGIAAAGLGEA